MIKYNDSNINDWYFAEDNIVKLYRNGAVVYYKVITSGDTPEYQVCYAVVDDISQYQDREFVDVFNKADEKWYKLNNLNQYEEYGVYGDSIASGGTSRLPQGYTEVEYIRNNNYNAYINTGVIPYDNTTNTYTITTKLTSEFNSNLGCATIISCENPVSPYYGLGYRYKCSSAVDELEFFGSNTNYSSSTVDNGDGTRTITFQSTGNTSWTISAPLSYFCSFNSTSYDSSSAYRFSDATIYSATVVKNGSTVRDFVPAKRDSDSVYGLYDLINDVFYTSPNGNNFSGGSAVSNVATYYEGKLAIVDGYEYQYSGNSWVNVGEVSGSSFSILSPEYLERNSSNNGYVGLGEYFQENTKIEIDFQMTQAKGNAIIGDYGSNDNDDWRVFLNYNSSVNNWLVYDFITSRNYYNTGDWSKRFHIEIGDYYIKDVDSGNYLVNTTKKTGFTRPNQMYLFHMDGNQNTNNIDYGKIYSVKIWQNDTLVKDFIPWTDGNGNYGIYDKVSLSAYTSTNQMTGSSTVNTVTVSGGTEYPIYYDVIQDPPNNLSFSSMTEAQEYAYNNCVYDGMRATIDGDRYYFDSEDENGWVKVLSYYTVEDVTPNAASGWTITGSSTYNPDRTYYDDFSIENSTTSNVTKIAKVTIYGYEHFTYYLRSYGYSTYAYVTSTNIDELQSNPTSMINYNSSNAITNTLNWNKTAGSTVNLSNYRRVTYNNLDKTVEHTFYVLYYGRTYSSYYSNATILIPKDQTNENWEQVTFSASSNVASAQKNLYIDGNNSTSGGTNYWYYRWMIGLPSGSHNSYTNYSNYEYCPSVTSSTFTSVSGETRQVNFTYSSTTNKSLQFRLVDDSGNTITTSSTVYYNMTYFNSCGVSTSSSNLSFPTSRTVKDGGKFYFQNSSNRHYIYGYSPSISLNTSYYVDNYNSYFNIPYTKLATEAVTITYTTYDPNDTEVPAFSTDITYPYNGGTTSSTTLTSYEVPYTYSYTVVQTSNLFSASTESYTAGQTSRTITFTSLYPNNREFSTVADLEAYQYAWEGMNASVGGTKYKYTNGSWVEETYTKYEYIRTENATSKYYMFNTNFYPTTANTFEVKVEFVDRPIDWGAIIEWRPGGTQNFEFDTVTGIYQAIIRTGGNNGITYRPTIGANNPTVYTLPLSASSGTYSINGGSTQTISYNYTAMSLPASTPMGIFGDATKKDLSGAVAKLYYLKVYDGNGNLVKHYIPSDSNGTPCLYEIINGDYILNTYSGTDKGTCTLGPAI